RSESGVEVVERRKGRSVIIRKRKKKEESMPEASPIVERDDDKSVEKTEEIKEIKTTKSEPALGSDTEQVFTESIEEFAETELPSEEELEKAVEVEKVKEEVVEKIKKKGRKLKPKKEEIIDEDTLEELRKAFKTKLPGRKREYLVEDRRSKMRPYSGAQNRGKARAKLRKETTKDAGISQEDSIIAEVIPFPAKPTKKIIKVGESITVGELAKKMGVKAASLIKKLMELGANYTINQSMDPEIVTIVAEEFGFEVTIDKFDEDELLDDQEQEITGEYQPRPPVVTVMGHVDHGKTTLLDTIRKANVVDAETGGITQHIGAYYVSVDSRKVVFIDTPGHEAFTSMRARGAKVTDIVILVVAADDGVMPQTIEAVNHAKAAGVPIIVAINKIDKPESNPDTVRRQLSEIGLVAEEWGGDTIFTEVSAKGNKGIKELLELILLQSDVSDLKAISNKRANGVVIEAELTKGRGPLANVIVNEGTLKVGDFIVAGTTFGKVRALIDDKGNRLESAEPSMPVEVMGISRVPTAGEKFYVVKNEKTAKEIVQYRESKKRQQLPASTSKLSLEDLFDSIEKEKIKELLLVIKADTQGSVEAIREAVLRLGTEKCRVKVVHSGVGAINETDVSLASASNAIVLGFNVRPDAKALDGAAKEGVSLELHPIIYDAVDRIKKAMEGLLEPVIKEKVVAHAEVKATFSISKIGTIAGCSVTDGKITRSDNVRVVRDGVVIFEGKLSSLKRFKDDVREVQSGFECGIGIESFNDIKVGDILELYTLEEIKQEL
ncbi:translation initiation factor IF-2, partial [Desulfobacterota bacterium AH_259_B03_O07]|nr:translation initiation factor IF-2 [Desulfobacterota bacterium AH_259_B03_O07]